MKRAKLLVIAAICLTAQSCKHPSTLDHVPGYKVPTLSVNIEPACDLVLDKELKLMWSKNLDQYAIRVSGSDLGLYLRVDEMIGRIVFSSQPSFFKDSCEAKGLAAMYRQEHPDWSDIKPVN